MRLPTQYCTCIYVYVYIIYKKICKYCSNKNVETTLALPEFPSNAKYFRHARCQLNRSKAAKVPQSHIRSHWQSQNSSQRKAFGPMCVEQMHWHCGSCTSNGKCVPNQCRRKFHSTDLEICMYVCIYFSYFEFLCVCVCVAHTQNFEDVHKSKYSCTGLTNLLCVNSMCLLTHVHTCIHSYLYIFEI